MTEQKTSLSLFEHFNISYIILLSVVSSMLWINSNINSVRSELKSDFAGIQKELSELQKDLNDIQREVTIIKTVLMMKDIYPKDMAKSADEQK